MVVLPLAACHRGATDHATAVPTSPAAELGTLALCKAYTGLPAGWGTAKHAGMAKIAAGSFQFGSQRGYAEERPEVHETVASFWIDRTEVTNAQFAAFVRATGYVTMAERPGPQGGAVVFVQPQSSAELQRPGGWWRLDPHANWRHPSGTGTSSKGRANQPVVDVTLADAEAYAHWLGHKLPSEIQWEYAAKAGRSNDQADKAVRTAHGGWAVNAWQGHFPFHNTDADGFAGTAPEGCNPANLDGLYDMVGNVWEWTRDRWTPNHAALVKGGQHAVPAMPSMMSTAPMATRGGPVVFNVIKGGSFLCSLDYCARARASSRQPGETDLPAVNVGFRTVSAVR